MFTGGFLDRKLCFLCIFKWLIIEVSWIEFVDTVGLITQKITSFTDMVKK